MRPLERIYQSPVQLLAKARADKARLKAALLSSSEDELRGALFDFSVTTYHILDWIKVFRPDLEQAGYSLMDGVPELKVLRDISNASKHIVLGGKGYATHAPTIESVSASAPALAENGVAPFRLEIELNNGQRLAVEDVADGAIDAWEKFFAVHGIK